MKKIFMMMLTLTFLGGCGEKKHAAHQAAEQQTSPLPVGEENTANKQDCSNCGMPAEQFPKWMVEANTQQTPPRLYFCSPRCMFIKRLEKDSPLSSGTTIQVTDYYDLKKIDATTAYYVIKSDVTGPMGHDLVPLATEQAAKDFLKEHKGEKIVRFDQVNAVLISSLVQ